MERNHIFIPEFHVFKPEILLFKPEMILCCEIHTPQTLKYLKPLTKIVIMLTLLANLNIFNPIMSVYLNMKFGKTNRDLKKTFLLKLGWLFWA